MTLWIVALAAITCIAGVARISKPRGRLLLYVSAACVVLAVLIR